MSPNSLHSISHTQLAAKWPIHSLRYKLKREDSASKAKFKWPPYNNKAHVKLLILDQADLTLANYTWEKY